MKLSPKTKGSPDLIAFREEWRITRKQGMPLFAKAKANGAGNQTYRLKPVVV